MNAWHALMSLYDGYSVRRAAWKESRVISNLTEEKIYERN